MTDSTIAHLRGLVAQARISRTDATRILDDMLTTLEDRHRELRAAQARIAVALLELQTDAAPPSAQPHPYP